MTRVTDGQRAIVYRELAENHGGDPLWPDNLRAMADRLKSDRSERERMLHPSHNWGKRPTLMRAEGETMRNRLKWVDVPCCLNCLVDGYDDEPDAFEPCRRIENPVSR